MQHRRASAAPDRPPHSPRQPPSRYPSARLLAPMLGRQSRQRSAKPTARQCAQQPQPKPTVAALTRADVRIGGGGGGGGGDGGALHSECRSSLEPDCTAPAVPPHTGSIVEKRKAAAMLIELCARWWCVPVWAFEGGCALARAGETDECMRDALPRLAHRRGLRQRRRHHRRRRPARRPRPRLGGRGTRGAGRRGA